MNNIFLQCDRCQWQCSAKLLDRKSDDPNPIFVLKKALAIVGKEIKAQDHIKSKKNSPK